MRLRPSNWNRSAAWNRPGWPRFRGPGTRGLRPGRPGWLPTWATVQRLPLTMMIACLLAALGTVQMTFLIGNGLYRSYVWQQETRTLKREMASLSSDLKVLQDTQAHADDPQELQALARCLGFVGRSETVIVAQNAQGGTGNNCDAVRMP